jgi:hypothetical protein
MLTRNRAILLSCVLCTPATVSLWAQGSGPAQTQASSATHQGLVYQTGWAGYIFYAPGSLQSRTATPTTPFKTIEAEWIVPSAGPSINCDLTGWFQNNNGTWSNGVVVPQDGSSIWVGLDGWLSDGAKGANTDILQAGTESTVDCWSAGPLPAASADFWIEWDGTRNIPHSDWPKPVVDIGDLIDVTITAKTDGDDAWQYATVTLENKTREQQTGQPALYTKSFPSGCLTENTSKCQIPHATLFGNTAEWVAEINFDEWQYCPEQQPKGQPCPNLLWAPNTLSNFTDSTSEFGTVPMSNISVTDINGNIYTPGTPGTAIPEIDWMTVTGKGPEVAQGQYEYAADNALLACATMTGPQSMLLARAPYSVVEVGDQGQIPYKPLTCDGSW